MNNIYLFELTLTFYFAAAIIGVMELFKSTKTTTKLMLIVAGAGFVLHTINIVHRYAVAGYIPISNPHESTSFFTWCIVLIFFVMEFRYKVGLLGSFILPLVFVLMLTASTLSRDIRPLAPVLQSHWFGIHTVLAFLSNAAFAMAFGLGIMYLIQEHYVKSKHIGDLFGRLPSLQTLDHLNYRLITVGVPLLTLAMLTGMVWAEQAWGSYWNWDARQTWSLITWLIYISVLHARLVAGWRGKKAAMLSILGFVSILVAFFGIKLLKKGLHVFL